MVGILLFVSIDSFSQNNDDLKNELIELNKLYDGQRYEDAYDTIKSIYKAHYGNASEEKQIDILDWAIRLSFLSEEWQDLDNFIGLYYSLIPDFSSGSLTESSFQLEEYIDNFIQNRSEQFVYVNKHRQNIDLVPSTVTVYTASDIEELGARNLLDLIRITPGFAELGDNNERLFGTRGSSGTTLQDILILVNRHRITDLLTNTNAPDWISLNYVEQIEFVRGPGSALFGGSAFSGVINIITKGGRKEDLSDLRFSMGNGNTFRDFSSEYNSFEINYEWAKRLGNIEGLYVSATYKQSGGSEIDFSKSNDQPVLPDSVGTTILRPADFDGVEYINRYAPSYNFLVNYNKNSFQVTANAQSSSLIYSRPSSLNLWNSLDQDSLRHLRRRVDSRQYIQAEYDILENTKYSHNGLLVKVGADHFLKDLYTTAYSFGIEGDARLIGDEYRGTISLEYSTDSLLNGRNNRISHFLVGGEAYVNNWLYNYYIQEDSTMVLHDLLDQFSDPGETRNEYVAAFYLQTEQHIINERLVATLGFRLNYHNEYSTFETFEWGEQISPRFALVWLPRIVKNHPSLFKFKLLYSSAFLPPPFLYRKGGISQFVGSDSLSSQSIESGEFVLFGDISKHFSYSFQRYVNKIDDNIIRVNDVYVNEPTEKRIRGYDLELKYSKIPARDYERGAEKYNWTIFANYSYVEQHNFNDSLKHNYFDAFNSSLINSEEALRLFPKSYINIGFNAAIKNVNITKDEQHINSKKITLGINAQWIGQAAIESIYFINDTGILETTPTSELQYLPTAFVVNAHIKAFWKSFSVGVSAYNVSNKEYYLPSVISKIQRQRAEGRMIYLDLKYRFNK